MGGKVAKPNPPADNEAKADNDLAMKGLEDTAERFLQDNRLGVSSGETLGYPLVDDKLIAQELKLLTQTENNVPSSSIEQTIDGIFSGDWKSVVVNIAQQLAQFFSGEVPKPADRAVYQKFQKSYLRYENSNVVQYSVLVVQTNASSTGTLTENAQACLQTAVCKGVIDYAKLDPQIFIFQLQDSQPDLTLDEVEEIVNSIVKQLKIAAELAKVKRELEYESGGGPASLAMPNSTGLDDIEFETYNDAKRPYQTYKQRMRALNDLKEQIHNQKEHKEQKEQKAAAAHISAGLTPVCVDLSFGGVTLGTLQLALRN